MRPETQSRIAIAAMTSVTIAWGAAFVGIKVLLESLSFTDLTLLRFAFSSLILLFLLPWYRPAERIRSRDWWLLVLLGALGVGGYHLSLNFGEKTVSAGVASLIVSTVPVMVAILAPFFLRERISGRKAAGIGLALAGVFVLIVRGTPGVEFSVGSLLGAAITALAPLSWAFNTVLSRPLAQRLGATPLTILMILAGSALLIPLVRTSTFRAMASMSSAEWFWLAYLVIPCTVGGYLVWFWALRQLDATRTATFVYLVPLWGLVWAFFLLEEALTLWVGLGGLFVLGGIWLVQERGRPGEPPPDEIPPETQASLAA